MTPHALTAVVAAVIAGDREILREPAILRQLAPRNEWPRINEAADALERIWREFDYLDSPEFEDQTRGKSQAVVAMLQKIHREPVRARGIRDRFERLLAAVPELGTAALLQLVRPAEHAELLGAISSLAADSEQSQS